MLREIPEAIERHHTVQSWIARCVDYTNEDFPNMPLPEIVRMREYARTYLTLPPASFAQARAA